MDIDFAFHGDVVERQELLNGTQSVTVEGISDGGDWTVVLTVSWNLGLIEYAGEGDLTLARTDDGAEVYASLVRVSAIRGEGAEDAGDWVLDARFDVDGQTEDLRSLTGSVHIRLELRADDCSGAIRANLI